MLVSLSARFNDNEYTPFDRECSVLNSKGESIPVLTLGSASFVNRAKLEFASSFKARLPYIIIGRFSSLSWDLNFLAGHNHRYKNVVSTYSMQRKKLVTQLISQMNGNPKLAEIVNQYKDKRDFDNHHQIMIGSDVWIGRGATILGGVKIGSGTIIGANSTVSKDVPPYAVVAGNPARIVKYRFDEETVKKFMAIKWWNWDIEKILENAPLMSEPEEFLEKHYTPELEKIPYDQIPSGKNFVPVEQYLAEGRKVYSFVADFKAEKTLWKRVVSGFCKSTLKNSVLIFWLGENATQADIETLKNFVNNLGLSENKIIHCIPAENDKIFSPYILRNSTHFITTREMISLECMDCLWDTKVKIVSALDDKIFDGEPAVNWNKIFEE